jgi:hypothetical protein
MKKLAKAGAAWLLAFIFIAMPAGVMMFVRHKMHWTWPHSVEAWLAAWAAEIILIPIGMLKLMD